MHHFFCHFGIHSNKKYILYLQSGTATGTCGTVSWQIEHLDTRLIVMWSVPFNYNIHDSYFAVGMIFNRGRFTSSSYWFNQMYYSEKGPYKRGHGGQNITFENSAVVVHATMEPSTYHPMLNISVLPQVSNLASEKPSETRRFASLYSMLFSKKVA